MMHCSGQGLQWRRWCCDRATRSDRIRSWWAVDISQNFTRRSWHRNVKCSWNGRHLTLTAENDFDSDGLALMDEFSDEITACMGGEFDDGNLRIVSIMEIPQ
jgi:hypothetical protein